MTTKKRKKDKVYWGGFVNGKLGYELFSYTPLRSGKTVSVFHSRKTAREGYEDVRRVWIVEVKK